MKRERIKGGYLSIIIITFILILLIFPKVSGNPVPIIRPTVSKIGGIPRPYIKNQENSTVYFKEETIRANISANFSRVNAEYIFENTGSTEEMIDICLPFIDVPWNLELYCNGNVSDYTWSWVNHVPLPSKRFFDENEIWSLKSIIFSLAVPAKNESIVQVDYNCDYSRHHSYSQNVELFRFKYIVSTGRYWNHSIDRARFEYTLHEDLYSYGGEEEWNVSQINDEIIFTRTYYDWIPDVEYVSLTWTYREEQVEKEVEDNDNFIAFWTSPLLLFTLILIPVLFIFSKLTIRNKVKR